MKKYATHIQPHKKKIRILVLGPSQVGKTALAKHLFRLRSIKLKGNLSSDTDKVEIYTHVINGIEIYYVDSPGFFDSRGRDSVNKKKIMSYITDNENDIDIVLWVSKVNNIINIKHKELLNTLTHDLGVTIWKKSIVVLTHANDDPPAEYIKEELKKQGHDLSDDDFTDSDEDSDTGEYVNQVTDEIKVSAWNTYTRIKKKLWAQEFYNIQCKHNQDNPVNVPVVLVENNKYNMKKINGVGVLRDGSTPILETLMTEIFRLIKTDKAPVMFLALAGDTDKLSDSSCDDSMCDEHDEKMPLLESEQKQKKKRKRIRMTEQQKALDNATHNVNKGMFGKNNDTGDANNGWCTLY